MDLITLYESFDFFVDDLRLKKHIDRSLAKDIVQATFIKLWKRKTEIPTTHTINFFKSCTNATYADYVEKSARTDYLNEIFYEGHLHQSNLMGDPILMLSLFAEEEWSNSIYILAENFRPYIEMYYKRNKSLKAIAEKFGITVAHANMKIYRGRIKMKKNMKNLLPLLNIINKQWKEELRSFDD